MYCRWLEIDEELLIGEDIVLKAMEGRRGKIRIGITAPDSVRITTRSQLVNHLRQYMQARKAG